ncbi:hypothetical protein C5167_021674 [Papaver somniferum]|uniref:uncharacterized 38.1 kDa protein-like n=1 Tax=Papaver somniferum TaxID=3469 RepID=UPI000E703B8D|nr:uncharacterized 38.1 kDa protein-like [Papaver somniferum]RZC93383.1 hypothetical protein C5167_021674 [Papaver somniferum]
MGMLSTICQVLVAGIAARFLYKNWFSPKTEDSGSSTVSSDHNYGTTISSAAVSVSTLAHDLLIFEITSQVPEKLRENVASSKQVQANWYKKLLQAWREANPTPKTPGQVSRLVILTLHPHGVTEVEGLLRFYGLPSLLEPWVRIHEAATVTPPSRPEGVKFELNTCRVDAYAVADGDGLTVYVDVADPTEATLSVPEDVRVAVSERSKARASKDKPKAKALHKTINDAGYRVVLGPNKKEILARKYRIRLRGIDAPENKQPFGKEAKKELTKLLKGNCVIVQVYGEDKYNRLVGDVYCNGQFAQEVMLKKGLAWHYAAFDKRPELRKWAKEAKAAGIGLWADSDPEEPWKWRKNNPTPYV